LRSVEGMRAGFGPTTVDAAADGAVFLGHQQRIHQCSSTA
jgi:hypothetical protein